MSAASDRQARVALALAAACSLSAACGPRGGADAGPVETCSALTGTTRSGTFTVCDSTSVNVDAGSGGEFLLVYLSSKPELCDSISEGIVPTTPDVLTIQLSQFNSMGMVTTITPGTYVVPTGAASQFLASAVYNDGTSMCSVQAASGSVVLTTPGGTAGASTQGTFNLAFGGTDTLSGSLNTPYCAPAVQPDGGFPDAGSGMTPLCQ